METIIQRGETRKDFFLFFYDFYKRKNYNNFRKAFYYKIILRNIIMKKEKI